MYLHLFYEIPFTLESHRIPIRSDKFHVPQTCIQVFATFYNLWISYVKN